MPGIFTNNYWVG